MPYKFDSIPINNPKLDRRVKLTEEDKRKIVEEYATGSVSIRQLARKYNVSRRLIQFTIFPERNERAKELFSERQKDGRYYDREKQNEYMKRHRNYKKKLWNEGLLKKEYRLPNNHMNH